MGLPGLFLRVEGHEHALSYCTYSLPADAIVRLASPFFSSLAESCTAENKTDGCINMYSRGITGVTSDQGSLHSKRQGKAYEAYYRLGDVITCAYEHLVNSNPCNAQELELELGS